MFGPEFVGGRGCLRRLGDDGPLVVVHRAQPRRTSPRDLVSAIDLSGRTLWTVPYSALYGDRERRAHRIDLVDDRVVRRRRHGPSRALTVAPTTEIAADL